MRSAWQARPDEQGFLAEGSKSSSVYTGILKASARLPLEEQTIFHDKAGGRAGSLILLGYLFLWL